MVEYEKYYLWIWSCLLERTGAKPSISSKKIIEGLIKYAWYAKKKKKNLNSLLIHDLSMNTEKFVFITKH